MKTNYQKKAILINQWLYFNSCKDNTFTKFESFIHKLLHKYVRFTLLRLKHILVLNHFSKALEI